MNEMLSTIDLRKYPDFNGASLVESILFYFYQTDACLPGVVVSLHVVYQAELAGVPPQ